MPRLRKILMIRKYFIIFFGVLLVFLWLNHRSQTEDDPQRSAFVPSPPLPNESPGSSLAREKQLRQLVRKNRFDRLFEDSQYVDNSQEAPPRVQATRYFVRSEKCRMPYVDPFSARAMALCKPANPRATCTNQTDLFQLRFNGSTKRYQLDVNHEALAKLGPVRTARAECNYRDVAAGGSSSPGPVVYFKQSCFLPPQLSAIVAECHEAGNSSRVVQRDAFTLLPRRPGRRRHRTNARLRRPSVIVLGLERMSRMNFQRIMPKTAKFVSQAGWIEMEGYNKVGDNTVQNLVPVLAGSTAGQVGRICGLLPGNCAERIPWIWKEYKRAGYVTALAEDGLTQGRSLHFPGFSGVPIDRQLRPLLEKIAGALARYTRFGKDYCIGRRLSVSYVYDFCAQFTSLESNRPAFGFFWSSAPASPGQDCHVTASILDDVFMEYMHRFDQQRLFEQAIVIVMSDQGVRFGELLHLSDSFFEERLPMLYIYLPTWFRSSYPQYAKALALNRNRLSSNFDLHNTLRHLLQLNATSPSHLDVLPSCPTSHSLLHTLPADRSCREACIEEHWCTCSEFVNQPLGPEMYALGKHVIYYVNRWMLVNGHNRFCQQIRLQDMEYAERKVFAEDQDRDQDGESMYGNLIIYRLRFRTYPNDIQFLATVRYNPELNSFDGLQVPDISRLTSAMGPSHCVQDLVAQKFCSCYPAGKLSGSMREWQKKVLTTVPIF